MVKGGKREGAGRPSLDIQRIYITLRRNQIAWLRAQGNASETVRGLIDRAMEEPVHIYEVGKPYSSRANWPELAQYNYRGGEHELVLFFNQPTHDEIRAVSKAWVEFALYSTDTQIVMLYRFGAAIPWSDAPYSIHLVPPEQRTLPPETGPEEGALLHVVLVDASNGIIRAMRAIAMPPGFTQALHAAIREQAQLPFTRATYNGALESLFAHYTSAELADMAGIRFSSSPA